MKKYLTENEIETMISQNPNKGFDICYNCSNVYEYGTLEFISDESFELICDNCNKIKPNKP